MALLKAMIAAPLLFAAALAVDTGLRLLRNYRAARTMGVPIRFIPISPLNPFWVLLDRKILSVIRRLPFGDNSFTRYNWRGWEVEDRWRSHHEMGDIWVLVTPLKNWVYLNDPDAISAVFRRGSDFSRPVFVNEILNVFGPNISSATGARWKTMRRIATRCFNEQNNEIVWHEAIVLAGDMLRYWASKEAVTTGADDLRTLSLLILSRAGFGKSFKFEGHDDRKISGSPSSDYKHSLQTILENLILIVGFGLKFLSIPWLPQKLRNVHLACVSFQSYMTNMYEEEKVRFSEGKDSDHNLMTMLIRASQEDAEGEGGLTESEIYGNMFTFNFAGHDTTAHTFTFALYFLAGNHNVQDWLAEEIEYVLGDQDPQDWDYRTNFPRLKRCLSIIYETIRLYTVVPVIKWAEHESQSINVGGKTVVLPADSIIAPSYGSVQTDPRIWGPDSLDWRPSRWIKGAEDDANPANEEFSMPVRGAFVGWSDGNRDCPGKKFSQVEFVATMAVLFRHWRVKPKTLAGESIKEAQLRLLNLIRDDSWPVLLLQMLHPEQAPLIWERR